MSTANQAAAFVPATVRRALRIALVASGTLATVALLAPAAVAARPANAGALLYAYAGASTTGLTVCPQTATAAQQCSLGEALALVDPGDTILLATPGSSAHYIGNWAVSTAGTSPAAPVTIEPAPAVTDPILDGNGGKPAGCTTISCNSAVLTSGAGVNLVLGDLTIENGDDSAPGTGGGGAIENGNLNAGGTLTITGVTFSDDTAPAGGAIANALLGGGGTIVISDSTFTGDTAGFAGGAIVNGALNGDGSVTVADSTFTNDDAPEGGAIANGVDGAGRLTVADSTFFSDNATSFDGGAITNASGGGGIATITDSTFDADLANSVGGALVNGDDAGDGTLSVIASTISRAGGSAAVFNENGVTAVAGSIIAGSGTNCQGTITDGGGNLEDNLIASCGFHLGSDRLGSSDLAPLADNGGPTATMALGAGSAAIGLIPDPTSVTVNGSAYALCSGSDQRGYPRPGVGASSCDAGAYETQPSPLIVSEARLTGPPPSPADVYVDLYNRLGQPISLNGWSVSWITASGTTGSTPLTDVTLAAGGHYLLVTAGYSLATTPDATLAVPAGSGGLTGVQVIGPGGGVSDSVGYAGSADADGTGLTPPVYPTSDTTEIAFVRKFAAGVPVDTGSNAADFVLAAPDAGSNHYGEHAVLGTPAPSDAASPVTVNAIAQSSLYAPADGQGSSPNLTYTPPAGGPGTESPTTPGLLVLRRAITNTSTTDAITRLQIRITGLSTYGEELDPVFGDPSDPSGMAVLADLTEPMADPFPGVVSPTLSSVGSGLNSTLSVALPLETGSSAVHGLIPGQSVDVALAFDVYRPGRFALAYNVEDDLRTYHPLFSWIRSARHRTIKRASAVGVGTISHAVGPAMHIRRARKRRTRGRAERRSTMRTTRAPQARKAGG